MESSGEVFLRYIRPHWQRLHFVAQRYAAREEDARDLVQETLLKAWRGFSPTQDRTYRGAWLFVILRHVAFDWQRTAGRRIKLTFVPDSELTEIAPPDPTEAFCPLPTMDESRFREFLDERIVAALDALEPVFREVIVLSVAGGLNYREIAEVLDCPVGTVMSRMARARRGLREQLAPHAYALGRIKGNRDEL